MYSFDPTRSVLLLFFLAAILCVLVLPSYAQELYAGLDGHVKDPSGAVIANATVEVTSPDLIGVKNMQTDTAGYFRFSNLPPGNYTVTVSASGFRTYKQAGLTLSVGRFPTIEIKMEVGVATELLEVSGAPPLVDVSQSRVQTVLSVDVLGGVPKGRSYQSVIQFAPGARAEPLQGGTGGAAGRPNTMGYQVDGAGNAENSYLVEGQETANPQFGRAGVDVPVEFIQEVQVKSSGFEAEHGGAMGGVVNVIQKHGTNDWHGGLYMSYEGSQLDAAPDRVLRKNPTIGTSGRFDQPTQYWQPKQDHYRYVYPGFDIGGPFFKDRLWGFASFVPSVVNIRRTVNFAPIAPVSGPQTFNAQQITYYSLARLDALLTQKIRVFGAWQNNYQRVTGATLIPYGETGATGAGQSLPWPDDVFGATNVNQGDNVQNFSNSIGYVRPMVIYNVGGDITISPHVVSTTRFGYYYQDFQDRGRPIGTRYLYADSNYPYATGNVSQLTASFTGLSGQTIAAAYPNYSTLGPGGLSILQTGGWSNIAVNYAALFDKYTRYSLSQDVSFFRKFAGTHTFKVGYQMHKLSNDVNDGYNTALMYIAPGVQYVPNAQPGRDACAAIVAQNAANGWAAGGSADGSQCQGLWGTVNIRDLATTGKVGSWNHGLYLQDAWTVSNRLTLNLGIRFDKENLPSYNSGFKGISFDWTQKVAPRLGASFDVFGNRKVKAYFSYGWFYDIMKYELPRGSFGGDWWHDCVYALDTLNFAAIIPQRDSQNHYCPGSGGFSGAAPPNGLRFIENFDYRMPSNDPAQLGSLGPLGLIDPNLEPTKQHEYVAGLEWEIKPNLAFETRYSRKRLDRTIEDAGVIVQGGEAYYITNPGFGANKFPPSYQCVGCPENPKAVRRYDGLEFRVTKSGGAKWFGTLSYTYSKLEGNYSGLTATDISDGGAGRSSPDVSRAFDEPFMQFNAHGRAIDGPLATDRPHAFKGYGYYTLKWKKMETMFGVFQQWFSGTPLSSYISVWGAPVFLEGRGKFANVTQDASGNWVLNGLTARRTPSFSQTDFNLVHEIHVSKTNENLKLGFEANIQNLFNQHAPLWYNQNLIRSGSIQPFPCSAAGNQCPIDPATGAPYDFLSVDYKSLLGGFNYIDMANSASKIRNSLYGLPYGWQDPRTFRFKVKFTF